MLYFAGIGSRETPDNVLEYMTRVSLFLTTHGYMLRSGGAIGADSAFERGAFYKEIFRAEHATDRAIKVAKRYHPAWRRLSPYAKKLMGRNVQIIMGLDMDSVVNMVVCWTPDGKASGGTGQAIRLSEAIGVPIYNLFNASEAQTFCELMETVEALTCTRC